MALRNIVRMILLFHIFSTKRVHTQSTNLQSVCVTDADCSANDAECDLNTDATRLECTCKDKFTQIGANGCRQCADAQDCVDLNYADDPAKVVCNSSVCECATGYAFDSDDICQPVNADCPVLDNPTDGTVTTTGVTYLSTATYSCNSGFEIVGTETRTCETGGVWSGSAPTCADNDECTLGTDNCAQDATCTNTEEAFSCTCNSGYSGDGVTCDDVDECDLGTDNCAQDATCTNTEGAFSCTCNSGYSGDGVTCNDDDECALGTDNCAQDATCTNTEGAFSCTCNSGYSGDGVTCDDDDECSLGTDNCAEVATCTNTQGAFSCTCNSGYSGDGVTCDVDSSNDTMMLVIILSSVVVGLTLVIILLFICFCQYRRKIKGAAETNDKPVKENSNHNVIATNIRSTVREEEYDTIRDESDTTDVNALRETKNKDNGYLDIDLVNRNDLMQTYEKGVVRDQINECLDFNAVEQDTQDEYDYPFKGHKLSERGYVNVSGVRRTLPEIPKNSSATGKEGTNDPYSELKHTKLPEHVYERIADKDGYLKPLGLGNMKP